jgi:hypothetical protein
MTTSHPVTTPSPHHTAFAEAYATDALYDYLTDADAYVMGIIVCTIQWPIISEAALLKSQPGSKHWLKLVFTAVQWMRPETSLDAKLRMVAETAIELRRAMTAKDWFEFLCEEGKTLQAIHPSVLGMFANHLLDVGAAHKDPNLMADLMGLEVSKGEVLFLCGPLPLHLLKCLRLRSDLPALFSSIAFTDQLGRLVMKHKLRGLERVLKLNDLGNVFGEDLGL